MVASYGGPYAGNFIPSLIAYDNVVKELGYRSVYIFPEFVSGYAWVDQMRAVADGLYFVPYHQYTLDNVKRIRAICKQENAAMLYSRMSGWDLTARLAMPRLPMIWHMEMNLSLDTRKAKAKYWLKYRLLGGRRVYHISVSESTAKAINSLGVRHPCVWIPNAINLERLQPKTYQFGKPVKLLTFAYQPMIKGLDIALDACERLNADGIQYILLASAQTQTYKYIEERYGESIPPWLRLMPPTDTISDLFDEADILLCPSRSEGLSFANIEGLYSGLPVVYSDIPGNKVLEDFRLTHRFRSCDPDDLAEKIAACAAAGVDSDAQRENRQRVRQCYALSTWSESIE